MDKNNPAVFECKNHGSGIHHWIKRDDGTSYCLKCNLELNIKHTKQVFGG